MSTVLQSAPTSPPPIPDGLPAIADQIHLTTIEHYYAMAEAGLLGEEPRVELLEGLIVAKMTKHQPHILAIGLMQDALGQALPIGWYLEVEQPITIDASRSVPEPDLKVVRGARRDFHTRRVKPEDVAIVVEVADSSLRIDRTIKKKVYAEASIPTYWIVNLLANRLEVYSDPSGPGLTPDYRLCADLGPEEAVPLVLDGREVARIAVRDFLP